MEEEKVEKLYTPEDLCEAFEVGNRGNLIVECPNCEKEWYPSPRCCVSNSADNPFCPNCGTDFRE